MQINPDHDLQGPSPLKHRGAAQPGSVQSSFGFLQLVQSLLDLCLRSMPGPDQPETKVPDIVDALGTGVDLRLETHIDGV